MVTLVTISHLVNILVAGTVGYLLVKNAPRMTVVLGPASPARAILSSIYLAIAFTSLVAVLMPTLSRAIASVLFPLQILYKLSTAFTVGMVRHPVVLSNITISLLHTCSLLVIFY